MKEKKKVVLDVECYRDYFMVGVKNIDTGNVVNFELYEGQELDTQKLDRILRMCQVFTFNGNSYDIPMLAYALTGATNIQLKRLSDKIITSNLKSWQLEKSLGFRIPKMDHIDLIEVAPGQASLKIYGGRVHTPRMQDLPVEPDASITDELRPLLVSYNNVGDLPATINLRAVLVPQIDLRERLSEEYGMDLRSKSDAQIAEAVIKAQMERVTGIKPQRPEFPEGTTFRFTVPDFIEYQTDTMQEVLEMVRNADFVVTDTGGVKMPEELESANVLIGNSIYRMGIGGLHSSESSTVHLADEDTILVDRDVASYYPAIILGQDLYPKHLGSGFLKVYRKIVRERLAAKAKVKELTERIAEVKLKIKELEGG